MCEIFGHWIVVVSEVRHQFRRLSGRDNINLKAKFVTATESSKLLSDLRNHHDVMSKSFSHSYK